MEQYTDKARQTWDSLSEYAYALKSEGFRVMVPEKEPRTYFYIEKNGILAYVQKDSYFSFGYGTLNYPIKTYGTGYKMHSHVEATLEYAEQMCARNHCHHSARLYKSLEEYAEVNSWQTYLML